MYFYTWRYQIDEFFSRQNINVDIELNHIIFINATQK